MQNSSSGEGVVGIMAGLTGLGVLTIALAPLALPILILTIAALLPLLAVGLAVGLPIAVIAAAWLAIRAMTRRVRRSGREPRIRARTSEGWQPRTAAHSR